MHKLAKSFNRPNDDRIEKSHMRANLAVVGDHLVGAGNSGCCERLLEPGGGDCRELLGGEAEGCEGPKTRGVMEQERAGRKTPGNGGDVIARAWRTRGGRQSEQGGW